MVVSGHLPDDDRHVARPGGQHASVEDDVRRRVSGARTGRRQTDQTQCDGEQDSAAIPPCVHPRNPPTAELQAVSG